MRQDARIYVIAHRPVEGYEIRSDSLYSPVQVGTNERFLEDRDSDNCDNIAEWNFLYSELTGLYYARRVRPETLECAGMCQYRRRLDFPEDQDFGELFRDYDVIAAMPLLTLPNIADQYGRCHSPKDLPILRDVIAREAPDYLNDFDQAVMNGQFLFYANGFVMRREDFDRYCDWLFHILGCFCREKGWLTPEIAKESIDREIEDGDRLDADGHTGSDSKGGNGYQRQVCGFLSERLMTLWIRHNFAYNRIMCKPYEKFEEV